MLALALLEAKLRVTVVEARTDYSRPQFWSFWLDADWLDQQNVSPTVRALLESGRRHGCWSFLATGSTEHDSRRRIRTRAPYTTLAAPEFYRQATAALTALGGTLRMGVAVTGWTRTGSGWLVKLSDGGEIAADAVVEARGLAAPEVAAAVADWKQRAPGRWWHQVFTGWVVRPESVPDGWQTDEAVVMDARIAQSDGFRFIYRLPLGADRFLVEATAFVTGDVAPTEREAMLRAYLANEGVERFAVIETEQATLPMLPFLGGRSRHQDGGLYAIGTAGGQMRATTGYSVLQSAVESARLSRLIRHDLTGTKRPTDDRFARRRRDLYDRIFLRALTTGGADPRRVFSHFFRQPPGRVVRFLQGNSTLLDELRLIGSFGPFARPFSRATLAELVRTKKGTGPKPDPPAS